MGWCPYTSIADTTPFPTLKAGESVAPRGGPHPATLERLTVCELTAALRSQFAQTPSCEDALRKKLGIDINFTGVWNRFCTPVTTPRDGKNYTSAFFKTTHGPLMEVPRWSHFGIVVR